MSDDDKTDDLVLESTTNGARPRKKRGPIAQQAPEDKLKSDSVVVRLEGAFQIAYQQQWGFPVILNYGRDRAVLKKLAEQLGEGDERKGETLTASLMKDFFRAVRPVSQGGDPAVSRCRYSNIPDFGYHAQYLLLQRRRGPTLAARTADNVSEIAKATGRR